MQSGLRDTATGVTANGDVNTSTSRALIPVSPIQASARPRSAMRHPANFLAHLIATEQALPQTRERRRAEPYVAAATYSAAHKMVLHSGTHALARAI